MDIETEFLQVDGGRIGYEVAGPADGPLVVCAPAMGDIRQEYRLLAPLLVAAGYRVATMDIRGHGETSTGWDSYTHERVGADYLALVDHLGGPAVLIGTSYTPTSAGWAAAEAPGTIVGVVLISTWSTPQRPNAVMRLLSDLVTRRAGLWLMFYRTLYADRPADFAEYCARLKRNLAEPGRMAAVNAMGHCDNQPALRRFADVRCPALVVYGSKDPDFADPAAEARETMRLLSGTTPTLLMVEGAKHHPHVEQPDLVAAAVLPLLAEAFGA
ncbi:MAG: alpha/beta hydrolase [Actinocatenispora sp.]